MSDTALVAFDGSLLSKRAFRYADAVWTFPDATMTSKYVINPIDPVVE